MTLPASPAPESLAAEAKRLTAAYLSGFPLRSWDDRSEIVLGSGRFRYQLVNDWAKLPKGWVFNDVAAVAVDSADRVYAFNRSEHPVMVFDPDGSLVDSWGDGIFSRPHGIHVGQDDSVYCVDVGDHSVRKFTRDGKLLLTIGIPGKPAPFMSGFPFCRCTDVATTPAGDLYISDGYYNARVHKYSPDGKLRFSWGEPGTLPGQFNNPHNVTLDDDGWVYVADKENHRVQVFDPNGKYETQWGNMHRVCGLERHDGPEPLFYIAEVGTPMGTNRHTPNIGPRVSILSKTGEVLVQLGNLPAGDAPDRFISPHSVAIDSRGDVYLGEVSYDYWSTLFPGVERPAVLHTLRKFVKLS